MWSVEIAGGLLVAGWVIFWAGAFTPPYRQWMAPPKEYLEIVAGHRRAWLWTNGCFIVGVVATVAGFAVLADILERHGSRALSQLGFVAIVVGAVLWLVALAFRVSTTVSAAAETVKSSTPPIFFQPLNEWVGALFSIYMVLAYLSIAAYGGALVRTEFLPLWLGWASVAFGLVAAAGFVARVFKVPRTRVFEPPLMVHLMPGLMGVFLLVS
jgi:hypothetical protein